MKFQRENGFTLVEVMVGGAVGIVMVVAALTAYITLQKGLTFSLNWNSIRVSQQRVLDSMAVDLRNATSFSLPSGSTPVSVSGTDLACVIPMRYAASGGTPAFKTSGAFAGDPAVPITTGFSFDVKTGLESVTNTCTASYLRRSTGNNSEVEIVRQFQWTDSTGSYTVSRQVASFSNGVGFTYVLKSGSNSPVTMSNANSIELTATANVFLSNRTASPVVTKDTVYLREKSL